MQNRAEAVQHKMAAHHAKMRPIYKANARKEIEEKRNKPDTLSLSSGPRQNMFTRSSMQAKKQSIDEQANSAVKLKCETQQDNVKSIKKRMVRAISRSQSR